MKAQFTVTYQHEGGSQHLSCRSGKTSGEVAFLFHKFMQNVKGISPKDYSMMSIRKGEHLVGYTIDDKELQRTPDVRSAGATSTKFE